MKRGDGTRWCQFVLLAFVALTLAACGGGGEGDGVTTGIPVVLGQPGPGDAGNHFPFAVGNYWSYQVTSVESGLPPQTFVSTVSMTGTRQVNGATATVLQETNADGTNVPEDTFLVKDLNGIAEFDDPDSTDPLISQLLPVWDYRFPLDENSSFLQVNRKGVNSGDDLDGDGINEMVDIRSEVAVLGRETVTVPVGTFADCVKVMSSLTFIYILSTDGSRITATGVYHEWFSPGIGQVKGTSALSITLGNFTETTSETEELIGYSVGGQSQKIRIEASPATGNLSVGGALQLAAVAFSPAGVPVKAPPLVWLSNNPFVASVDANGLVRGVSAGSAFINATLVQGPFTLATNDVTVTVGVGTQPFQPLTSIQITPSPVAVAAGGTVQLTATGRDPYGNGYFVSAFTWQSGNTTVASVDANGLVTGVAPGTTTITASAGEISSPPVSVSVGDSRQIALATNDLVFDPFTLKIYASVPSRAGVNGDSVAIINPESGQVESFFPVGSEPKKLALSDDGRFLYVALDGTGSVARLDFNNPAAPVLDLTFPLGSDNFFGPFFVEDMEVMPGARQTVAISRMFKSSSPRHGGVAIFDNGVQRATTTPGHTGSNVIEFSSLPGILYGYNNETTEFGFRRMAVDAAGVTVLTVDSSFTSSLILGTADIEFAGGLIYASTGRVIDPEAHTLSGTIAGIDFGVQIEPDPNNGRVFFLSLASQGLLPWTIRAFNNQTLALSGSEALPAFSGSPLNLIRWGNNGLAFGTTGDQVLLVRTNLIP